MAKIMMIHHTSSLGGGSICLSDVMEMLSKKHEVIAYFPSEPKDLQQYLKNKDQEFKTYDIPIPTYNHYSGGPSIYARSFWKGLIDLRYIKEWEQIIKSESPDIVIVNSSVMALLGPVIRRIGAKSICFNRETFVEGFPGVRTKIMKFMLNHWFDAVLFISNYDMNYLTLTKPLVKVISDCISPNTLEILTKKNACFKLDVSSTSFNILFVGGISRIKGIKTALESLYYLKEYNISLLIAGYIQENESYSMGIKGKLNGIIHYKQIKYSRSIREMISNEVIFKNIKIIGHQTNMSTVYSASDVVVFPSGVPHQSRPAYEAGFYSIPVIISNYRQTSEYIVNMENGLVFEAGDPERLAEMIKILYKNQYLCIKLGRKNNEFTNTFHDFEKEKSKLVSLINMVLLDNK